MRRTLGGRTRLVTPWCGALLAVSLVAGCGDADDGPVAVPTSGSTASGSTASGSTASGSTASGSTASGSPAPGASGSASPGTGAVDVELVRVLSGTSVGGRVSTAGVPLPDVAAARRFAQQFGDSGMGAQIVGAVQVTPVLAGRALYAATVAIGCSPAEAVEVTRVPSGYAIAAAGEPSPHVECFAPVTSVALVLVTA